MQETNFLKLRKPDEADFINVEDLNYNADVLDRELNNLKNNSAARISTTDEAFINTLLNNTGKVGQDYLFGSKGDKNGTISESLDYTLYKSLNNCVHYSGYQIDVVNLRGQNEGLRDAHFKEPAYYLATFVEAKKVAVRILTTPIEVINDLIDSSTERALSAAQGKWLNENKLGKNEKAADSDKLDGHDSTYFATATAVRTAQETANQGVNAATAAQTAATQGVNAAAAAHSRANEAYTRAEQAFQSASEGKTKVANTLTGMGTPTSTTATWDQIVNDLKQHKYKIGSYLAANQLDSRYPGRVAFLYNKWAWNYPLCAMDCDDMAYVLVYDINKKAVEIWRSPLTYSAAPSDMEIFKSIKIGSTQYSYPYGFPFFADKAFGIYFIEPAAMNKFRYIKIHINGTILVDRTIDVQGTISGKIWAYPVRNLLCITTSSKIYRYDISGTGINKLNEFDISKVLNKDVLCCGTDYIMSVMNYAAKTYDYSGNIHWDIPDFMASQSYPAWVSGRPPRIGFVNNYGAFYLTRLTEHESHYNVFTHWANPYNKTKGILEQPTTTGWYSLSDANMPDVSYSDNCLITAYGGRSNDPEFNYKCRIWVQWVPKFNNGYHINEATGGAFKVKRGIVSAWVSTTQDGFGRVCGIYSEDNVYTVAIVDTMNYSKIIS